MIDTIRATESLLQIARLNEREADLFRSTVNALFTGTFIIRGIEQQERLYRFAVQNFELIESYIALAGWTLKKDENLGVIMWEGPAAARVSFRNGREYSASHSQTAL